MIPMQTTKQADKLIVSDNPVIPFIEGDGIGKEITPFVQKIIDAYETYEALEGL